MGADTTSTQLIFFIAATVVATATAGIFTGVVGDLTHKATDRARSFGDEITSEVKIINDPSAVVTSPDTLFYVKNTGSTTLDWFNMTVFVDGALVTTTKSLLGGETTFRTGAVVELLYDPTLPAGDHRVAVSMENGVHDELRFRI
jgi:archaellum component FlaG (FlaF/FlaG flagellin family)